MLLGRTDTQHHAYGLETCENWFPSDEGPIIKRPGFAYIRDADPTASWLSAFRFSVSQEYCLEWAQHSLRFFTNGGRIETAPNVPYTVTTPYAASDAPAISSQQSYDRLYLDHTSYAPAMLSRTDAITFSYAVSSFADGPFADQNTDQSITVSADAVTGSVTLTASAPIFQAGHVGSLFKLECLDFSTLHAWEAGMKSVPAGMQCRSDGKVYLLVAGSTTGGDAPTHTEGSEWDGMGLSMMNGGSGPYGCLWQYLSERAGTVQITGYTSATQVTGTVIKRLPDSLLTVPSWRWTHGLFSSAAGWPGIVKHWKGRQIHFKGLDVVGSVVGDYLNHASTTSSGIPETDLAFIRRISTDNPPLWVIGDKQAMVVGTSSTEMAIGPVNASMALSGTNIEADPQSEYGSEPVAAIKAGTYTIFVERGGRRMRAADFNFAKDRYDPVDLTSAARHITSGGILQLAYQRTPYAMIHGVRADGQIVTHAFTRGDIKGWARIVLGGNAKALSAVSIVGADGKADELWVLVSRSTPSGVKREIWKQMPWRELGDNQRQSFYVDGGVTATAVGGQTHFSGLTHLAGQSVVVLADGAVITDLTVANDGTLDLPADYVPATGYTVTIGLPYTALAVTLRPEPSSKNGSVQGLRQKVVKLVLRLLDTFGIKAGTPDGSLDELLDRPGDFSMDGPAPLFSGDTDGAAVECDWGREGQLRFVSDLPLPAIITSAMVKLEVDDKDV